MEERTDAEARSYSDYYGGGYRRGYRRAEDQLGAYSEWDRSGGGCCCGGGGASYGGGESSLFSDGTLFALLAAAALAFYILYTTVTMAAARKRKRRGVEDWEDEEDSEMNWEELLWQGLEEFEEKIDRIADGEDSSNDSWISKIYNQFSFFNDGDNSLAEADLDGLEPPILDETWGLGVRSKDITANTTVSEALSLEDSDKESGKNKRSVEEYVKEEKFENTEGVKRIKDPEEKCRVDMWRCLSKVIEGGLHYMDKPEGLMGLAKKTMFKMAFHGGFSNVWSGVMTIPEARAVKKCMSTHTECMSYEILRREAQATLDPSDPAHSMYDTHSSEMEGESLTHDKEDKKERLIINPEFVESLDTGDGSVQYNEDYEDNKV